MLPGGGCRRGGSPPSRGLAEKKKIEKSTKIRCLAWGDGGDPH